MTLALPAVIFDVNTPFVAPILPALALPVTFSDDNEPSEVMFGCDAVVSVPVNNEAPIVPELA